MLMSKELDFVARYYRKGTLDVGKAYRRTLEKAGRRSSVRRWIAVAAAVAVLLVAGTTALLLSRQSTAMTIMAESGNRTVHLADGTTITLAPHSSVTYDKADCRSVELSGKAYLNIRHDEAHPFIITDEDYVIRDIGTQLVVDETALSDGRKSTSVYVVAGSVSLMAAHGEKGVVVGKGDMYRIAAGSVEPRRVSNAPSVNAVAVWATHEFHFSATPLSVVLRDLSDYYGVTLTCAGGEGKRLTADFHADSITTIVGLIDETLDVRINIGRK